MSILRAITFFFFLTISLSSNSQTDTVDEHYQYSVDRLRSDFNYLRKKLEEKHPALYMYTPKVEADRIFDSLYNSINHPLIGIEFYNLVTLLNGKISDGHTMFLPPSSFTGYFDKNGRFFPFYVYINEGKLFVSMNCSSDTTIMAGAEILRINDLPAGLVLDELIKRQIHDGHNQTYPVWILNNYFKEYYSFTFGHPVRFDLSYRQGTADSATITVDALSKDSIRLNRNNRYAGRIPSSNDYSGIVLAVDSLSKTGTLTIKSFDKRLLRTQYKQVFEATIEKLFADIRTHNLNNLILDLRNNQGGDFENGVLLLSHLLLEPVEYLANSNQARHIDPLQDNYRGKLYVLINGGSFSNSGIVSSYLQATKRAVFIGEETAGNRTVLSGDAVDLILPETRINVEISTKKYSMRDSLNDGHGIIPDHYIVPTIQQVISNQDPVMEFAIKLISGAK